MSQAPHVVRGARWGELRLGEAGGFMEDLLWAALTDTQCGLSMAQTAEKLADQYGVTREEADLVALRSQQRAKQAWDEGRMQMRGRARPGQDAQGRDALQRRRAHAAGHDAGNARGAAALLPQGRPGHGGQRERHRRRRGRGRGRQCGVGGRSRTRSARPAGRVGHCRVPPEIMGIGPAPAARKALEKAGLSLDDMDLVDINEAFAPQFAAVAGNSASIPEKTNVNGGAVALTHPLAASGARITANLLHELRHRGARYGLGRGVHRRRPGHGGRRRRPAPWREHRVRSGR
jgi:acetyl-CoA acyltransferase 2